MLVLQDINVASCYSDRVVAMRDGRLFAQGSTASMIDGATLKQVYDMNIAVHELEGERIAVYFADAVGSAP